MATRGGSAVTDRVPASERYAAFVLERFPPGAYLPLICLFAAAGYVPSVAWSQAPFDPLRFAATAFVIGLAFFHLRLVDEVKDAEIDRVGRPSRPLPRGLVTEHELTRLAIAAYLVAVVTATALGVTSLIALVPAAACILLADVEFLAPRRIHHDIVSYALAHSLVVPLLMVFAWFAAIAAQPSPALGALVVLAWGVGLGLEITRKTYASHEERALVETYSSVIGHRRAGWLAAGSLSLAMVGGTAYAGLAGGGASATVAGLVGSGVVLFTGRLFGHASHRTTEAVGGIVAFAILLWPIAIAGLFGGAGS